MHFLKENGCDAFVVLSYVDPEKHTRELETVESSSRSYSFIKKHDIPAKYYMHLEGKIYNLVIGLTHAASPRETLAVLGLQNIFLAISVEYNELC